MDLYRHLVTKLTWRQSSYIKVTFKITWIYWRRWGCTCNVILHILRICASKDALCINYILSKLIHYFKSNVEYLLCTYSHVISSCKPLFKNTNFQIMAYTFKIKWCKYLREGEEGINHNQFSLAFFPETCYSVPSSDYTQRFSSCFSW